MARSHPDFPKLPLRLQLAPIDEEVLYSHSSIFLSEILCVPGSGAIIESKKLATPQF